MINKIIAICLLIVGGIFVLQGLLPDKPSMPDAALDPSGVTMPNPDTFSREKLEWFTINNPDSLMKLRSHRLALSDMRVEAGMSHKTNRKMSNAGLLLGAAMLLIGLLLYRRVRKYIPLPANLRIKPLIKQQNRYFLGSFMASALLFILTFLLSNDSLSRLAVFLLVSSAIGMLYALRELIFINDNFGNAGRYLVNWEYPDGDVVVVTRWGLMKYNQYPPEPKTSLKFEGVKWEFDNLKDLAEGLVKGEGISLSALLPSIEFSTTSNRIEDYIPFSFWDTVQLVFVELDPGYLLIMIEKRVSGRKYILRYPLPTTKASLRAQFEGAEHRIARWAPARALYLDQALIDQVSRENVSSG